MTNHLDGIAGKWFESNPGKREKIFLATKFANYVDENGQRQVSSTPEYARQACEKSLARLKVKQIDLYYCHREFPFPPFMGGKRDWRKCGS